MALAEHLGLTMFSLLGNSGGGPYVAACASVFPERIRTAVIVSGAWQMNLPEARDGMPLPNRLAFWLARRAPTLLGVLLGSMAKSTPADMDKERVQLKARVPAADYEAFMVPGRLEAFSACLRDALTHGTKGAALDMGLFMKPFGFEPADVGVPITWFHGERDANVPVALARLAVATLPGAQLVSYPEDAHLSTLCTHIDAIARALKSKP
jgi:pimeloyl-ACP methyl ester carboxylesterase